MGYMRGVNSKINKIMDPQPGLRSFRINGDAPERELVGDFLRAELPRFKLRNFMRNLP